MRVHFLVSRRSLRRVSNCILVNDPRSYHDGRALLPGRTTPRTILPTSKPPHAIVTALLSYKRFDHRLLIPIFPIEVFEPPVGEGAPVRHFCVSALDFFRDMDPPLGADTPRDSSPSL